MTLYKNQKMQLAKMNEKDEFYTTMEDVVKELDHYSEQFEGKVIYCCCDTTNSNFVKYFMENFERLKLKNFILSSFGDIGKFGIYNGSKLVEGELDGDGCFLGEDVSKFWEVSDIIITNPPFSLFRGFIDRLVEYGKEYIILGNMNAVTYKNVFPLFMENKLWFGYSSNITMKFQVPDEYDFTNKKNGEIINGKKYLKVPSICWFTNLNVEKRNEYIPLETIYDETVYKKYDNYNAIEISKVKDIPKDYYGIMGVPISFLTRYNPDQFKILGSQRWSKSKELLDVYIGNVEPPENDKKTLIDGKETYDRIFIRRI